MSLSRCEKAMIGAAILTITHLGFSLEVICISFVDDFLANVACMFDFKWHVTISFNKQSRFFRTLRTGKKGIIHSDYMILFTVTYSVLCM